MGRLNKNTRSHTGIINHRGKYSMIQINDKFSTERDKYQWLLHEEKDGLGKDDQPITTTRTAYHPNLKAVCNEVINRSLGECENVNEIKKALNDFSCEIDNMSLFERERLE